MTGPRPPEPTKDILNIDEAAQLLGVSSKTFAKVLREGEIPGRKIGREWKFSRLALIDWVARGQSVDFIESDSDSFSTPTLRVRPSRRTTSATATLSRAMRSEMSIEED